MFYNTMEVQYFKNIILRCECILFISDAEQPDINIIHRASSELCSPQELKMVNKYKDLIISAFRDKNIGTVLDNKVEITPAWGGQYCAKFYIRPFESFVMNNTNATSDVLHGPETYWLIYPGLFGSYDTYIHNHNYGIEITIWEYNNEN